MLFHFSNFRFIENGLLHGIFPGIFDLLFLGIHPAICSRNFFAYSNCCSCYHCNLLFISKKPFTDVQLNRCCKISENLQENICVEIFCRLKVASFQQKWTVSYLVPNQDVFKRNSKRQTSVKLDISIVEFISWSSRPKVFSEKGILKKLAIFIGKCLCSSFFLIKLQAWKPLTLLQRHFNTWILLWIFLWISEIFKSFYFEEHL